MSNLINPQPARQRTPSPNPTSPLSPISPWPPLPRSTTPSSNQDAPISANNVSNDGDGATSEHSRSQSVASTSKGDELPTAKEIYGLIAVLGTYLAFGVYLVWAFTPDEWLHAVGWTWYPSREWAVIVPCYLMVMVLLAYFSYAGITAYLTPSFSSVSLITDSYSGIPARSTTDDVYYWNYTDRQAIPEAVDLPIDLVNRVLYRPKKS